MNPSEREKKGVRIHANTFVDVNLEDLSSDFSKLLTGSDVCDVKLVCEGVARPAHRSVLAARSEVFAAMFRNKMAESISGVVSIDDLDGALLEFFLEYVYTGKLSHTPGDRMHELYAAADKYAVLSLKKECSRWMTQNMSEDNYQTFLVAADTHGDRAFKAVLIASIVNNPNWLDCELWFNFLERHPKLANEVYRNFYNRMYFKKE